MTRYKTNFLIFVLVSFAAILPAAPLEFSVEVGTERNRFIQGKNGSFHILTRTKPNRRLVIASPAGNTGAALWFSGKGRILADKPRLLAKEKVEISFDLGGKSVVTAALLGSIRTIRDFNNLGYIPHKWASDVLAKTPRNGKLAQRIKAWFKPQWTLSGGGKVARRTLLGLAGVHRYTIELQCSQGVFAVEKAKRANDPGEEVLLLPSGRMRLIYWSTQEPLTPFRAEELLTSTALKTLKNLPTRKASQMGELLNGLQFLAYREKFLAGSWRFLTYFGRDTLISLRLLMPALSPQALEAGLGAVLSRLDKRGEVAHEESLACQAAKERLIEWAKSDEGGMPHELHKAVMDRKMVDDVYLVLPLLMDYYFAGGRKLFQANQANFLPLLRNINHLLAEANVGKLIKIEDDGYTGDWRDSNEGLGWGRYPFSVNGVHVPAALEAFHTLLNEKAWKRNKLLYTARKEGLKDLELALVLPKRFLAIRDFWNERWRRFLVELPRNVRLQRLRVHQKSVGLKAQRGRRGVPYRDGFLAVSLDADMRAVPIIQGDTSLALMDLPLSEKGFSAAISPFENSFPDGLFTEAGVLVATAALANSDHLREIFDRNHYHGEVVWGWPQIALHIALLRRLGRWVTPPPQNSRIGQSRVERLERRVAGLRRSLDNWAVNELWTWKVVGKKLKPVAYGQEKSAATESNAAQLWSVAALGVDLWLARE